MILSNGICRRTSIIMGKNISSSLIKPLQVILHPPTTIRPSSHLIQYGTKYYSSIFKNNLSTMTKTTGTFSTIAGTDTSTTTTFDENALVKIDMDVEKGIAVLSMNRPPVNSLSLEMCQSIANAIDAIESNKQIKVMIITSASSSTTNSKKNSGIFSAGLDLTELYQSNDANNNNNGAANDRLRTFWSALQDVYLKIYGNDKLTTIAAINGHAPAAGCMIALSCDYRIMRGGGTTTTTSGGGCTIGYNESKFGLVTPPWFAQLYVDAMGPRRAELALTLGTLYTPEEAKHIGLIDEIVEDVDDVDNETSNDDDDDDSSSTKYSKNDPVLNVAYQRGIEFNRTLPLHSRLLSKQITRQANVQSLVQTREDDINTFYNLITSPQVQNGLGLYLQQLKKKR